MSVDGRDYQLPLDNLDNAKIVPDWDAVLAGQSGVIPVGSQTTASASKKPAAAKPVADAPAGD